MSGFRSFLKKYFSFDRRERNGLILLFSIMFILTFSLIWLKSQKPEINVSFHPLVSSETIHVVADTSASDASIHDTKTNTYNANQLFVFDPNTVTLPEARQLGFSEKQFKVLENYRNKGGRFKTAADLKKVYGVTDKLFASLEPYILIQTESKTENLSNAGFSAPPPPQIKKVIEINSADSLQLVSLNGIGPTLCRRILIFRNMLGGFASKEQLKEVYGMRDSLYALFSERIMVDNSLLKKININSATIDELKKHAYIKFMIAQSIVNYREKHGKYTKADDLLKVGSLSEETIKKLAPYLEF